MADKNGKYKTSRRHAEDSRSNEQKYQYQEFKKNEKDGNTPPLPSKRHSIEELINQRESLKEELEQLDGKPDKSARGGHKRKYSDNDRKYSKSLKTKIQSSPKKSFKTRTRSHISPEYNVDRDLDSDSEDEESIIEQRRKQRKQLLEKLSVSDATKHSEKNKNEKLELDAPLEVQELRIKVQQKEDTNTSQLSDMFSENDDFITKDNAGTTDMEDAHNTQLNDNWDDAEGYYKIRVGDTLKSKYVLKEILGKGVFANVVQANDITKKNAPVAIKIVRNNDLMYRTSLKEITILKEIYKADPDQKYHCVKYMCNFIHKGHLCIVLEALHMDLRSILKKYGKNHGINMKALTSYSRQLLMALRLLKKIGIIHADIKPDNILVNEKKNVLKLCDFGSAAKIDENEPTPYLVSRFYRAPEIILGLPYSHGIDIWSTACTIFEMATGRILFTGNSNNRMLKCFMDIKGKVPVKLIRKGKFKDQHFNYNNNFLLHKKDEFTGRDRVIEVSNNQVTRDLYKELLKSSKDLNAGEEKKLAHLKDILDKMLMLDPNQRPSVSDCLRHAFIQEELEK